MHFKRALIAIGGGGGGVCVSASSAVCGIKTGLVIRR
jgi:hypothetical protein